MKRLPDTCEIRAPASYTRAAARWFSTFSNDSPTAFSAEHVDNAALGGTSSIPITVPSPNETRRVPPPSILSCISGPVVSKPDSAIENQAIAVCPLLQPHSAGGQHLALCKRNQAYLGNLPVRGAPAAPNYVRYARSNDPLIGATSEPRAIGLLTAQARWCALLAELERAFRMSLQRPGLNLADDV